jgi:fructose-specific component phosphotransferase system IIB-like protein
MSIELNVLTEKLREQGKTEEEIQNIVKYYDAYVQQEDLLAKQQEQKLLDEQAADRSVIGSILAKGARGWISAARGAQAFKNNIIFSAVNAFNPDLTSEEKQSLKLRLDARGLGLPGGSSVLAYDKIKQDLSDRIRLTESTGVSDAIDKGNYAEAAELAVGGLFETTPSIAAAFSGYGGIALFGASVAGNKFDEEFKADPEQSIQTLMLNSAGTGALESTFELATRGLMKYTGLIANKTGSEAAKDFLKSGFTNIAKKVGVATIGEGIGEAATELSVMGLDAITLGKDLDLFAKETQYRLLDAGILGGLMGGGFGTLGSVNSAARNRAEFLLTPIDVKQKMLSVADEISRLTKDLSSTQTEEGKRVISDKINKLENNLVKARAEVSKGLNSLNQEELNTYAKNQDEIIKLQQILSSADPDLTKQTAIEKIKELQNQNYNLFVNGAKRHLAKNIETIRPAAERLGVKIQEFNTAEDFATATGQSADVDGFIQGNNIFINNQKAAEVGAISVGSHELLHRIINSKLTNKDTKEELANGLIEILRQEGNLDVIQKRIDDNYKFDKDGNERKFDEYADEYFTVFSDAIVKGDIQYKENVFQKILNFFNSFINKFTPFKQAKFNTAQQAYDFVRDYSKNIRKGVVTEQAIDLAGEATADVKASITQIGDQIRALVPQGTTKQQYDTNVIGDVYNDLVIGDRLNGLIRGQLNRFGVTGDNVFGKPINNFVEDVKQQLFERSLTRFNPETNNDLGGFVVSELQQFRIGDVVNRYRREQAGGLDIQAGEVGAVQAPVADVDIEAQADTAVAQAPRSALKQSLTVDGQQFVDQKLEDEIEANTIEIVEGVTPETNDKDFKTFVKDAAQQKSFKSVKNKLKNFDKFLEDNIDVLFGGNNLPIATLVAMERRTPAANRIFTGEPTRLTTQAQIDKAIDEGDFYVENEKQGPSKYPRKKPTIEQVKNFFFNVGASTKGTRKDGLVNAISFGLFRDIVPGVMNRADIVQEDIAKVSAKLIVDPNIKFSKSDASLTQELNQKFYKLDDKKGVDQYIANFEKIIAPAFEDGFLNSTISVNSASIADKQLRDYTRNQLKARNKKLAKKNKKYAKTKFDTNLIRSKNANQIKELNKRNVDNFTYMWMQVYESIKNDKSTIPTWLHWFRNSINEGTHPHRLGAEYIGSDKTVTGKLYFEHALQNANAYRQLIKAAAQQNKQQFTETLNALKNNYKLLGVSRQDNNKLDVSGFKDKMSADETWNIFDNNWWERYFNETVASIDGGINPDNLVDLDGKTFAELYGIDASGSSSNANIESEKNKVKHNLPGIINFSRTNSGKILNDLNNYDKALRNARDLNAPKKGISIFDFDDTLATTDSKVIVNMPDGNVKEITPAEFAKQHESLQNEGATFDFSQFNEVIDGKPGPLVAKLKKAIDKFGNKDVFVLTARPQASAQAIFDFLKGIGLEIPLQNITGLEDGTPQAKANWVIGKAGEGYNDFYFTDDVYKNVKAVQDALEVVDVKSKTRLAYSDRVKKLDRDFNDIIEAKTGIAAEKEYGRAKAEVVGANKGKFTFFIPPSAEDFVGLLYKTLSKGKLGDSQMAWYKKNLIDPFASAMAAISRERIALMDDYKALKKQLNVVPKNLRKKIPGENFTNEQAVRVYIWNKQGMTVPGLSKADLKDLTDYIENNNDLKVFGDQLIAINKAEGYTEPTSSWLAGTITTDIMRGLGTTKRAKHLQQWQQNVDIIFSEKNLNKLEAANGKAYRVALEGMLQRMKTGRNRSFSGDSNTGKVVDWLTNSIGTIMFFNTRSALLQTISAVNFVNFTDNNIFKAGKAYANQKQFWSDFAKLMNSEFLVDRRRGLRINVNEADIANMAREGGARGVISKLLEFGFLPTQIADSFAIASGGATFYRNRINTYKKQGLSDQQAQEQAFNDFREIAEESQQSSRPDRISQQQAGPLGRIILAFANTPMQYARLIKKAASDLKNRRGDVKTNISKIIYYGFVQNLIFNALQQAVFAIGFGNIEEEEDEKEKYTNIANGMLDSLLRGIGIAGAFTSAGKNIIARVIKESKKDNPKYEKISFDLVRVSPPLSSKLSRLNQAGRALQWEKQEMIDKGFAIDNPALMAGANVVSAVTNLPIDRLVRKANNVNTAVSQDLELWERFALLGGWQAWELGIEDEPEKPKSKPNLGETRATRKVKRRKKRLIID